MALNLDLIIEPESLAAVLKNEELLIIDVSQASTYQQVHVPGAVHVNPSELVARSLQRQANCPSYQHWNCFSQE